MNVYTIIPARGGSKSIPEKNIKVLNGRPLIDYSIKYSLACPLVKRTIVSTDSQKIADIALSCGAEVPFLRPIDLAQDNTRDYPVFEHALKTLEQLTNEPIDLIILLRPTSPLRPPNLIQRGIQLMNNFPSASSLRSVAKSTEHPFRQWKLDGDFMIGYESGTIEPYNIPRQELSQVFFQTGDIEIIRRETLLNGSISGKNVLPLVLLPEEMVDIDDMVDWAEAEKKIRDLNFE